MWECGAVSLEIGRFDNSFSALNDRRRAEYRHAFLADTFAPKAGGRGCRLAPGAQAEMTGGTVQRLGGSRRSPMTGGVGWKAGSERWHSVKFYPSTKPQPAATPSIISLPPYPPNLWRRQRVVGSVVDCRKSTADVRALGRVPCDDGRPKQPSQQEPPACARGAMLESIHVVHLVPTFMSVIFGKSACRNAVLAEV